MTYKELYESAIDKLEKSKITLGEFEKMIGPLNAEVATDTNVGNKDTISRKAAINALGELITGSTESGYAWFYTDDVYKAIKQLPPAQPERIKGHWIEIALSNHTYKCSVCGRLLVNITDGKNNVAKNYPYCHCGADMRGEQK